MTFWDTAMKIGIGMAVMPSLKRLWNAWMFKLECKVAERLSTRKD